MNYLEYKLYFLSIGDAYCIVISYWEYGYIQRKIAVIDAENVDN